MFFSALLQIIQKMGYPKAIVRALDFLKNTRFEAIARRSS